MFRHLLAAAVVCCTAKVSQAHFVWLVTEEGRPQVYFAESPRPGDPELIADLALGSVQALRTDGTRTAVAINLEGDRAVGDGAPVSGVAAFFGETVYGTLTRGESTFLLRYWPKSITGSSEHWGDVNTSGEQRLAIQPLRRGGELALHVTWDGAPLAGAAVEVRGPGLEDLSLEADEAGAVHFALAGAGRYAMRVRHVEDAAGVHAGTEYSDTRHYSTLTLDLDPKANNFPPLPQAVTSFGAAIADGALYVYGGHTGEPHNYSVQGQSGSLRKLDLRAPSAWEDLAGGQRLQGLAMVAHGGSIYRMGGFTALNQDGEEDDLHSQAGFARFDPERGEWEELTPMPEARSSFDAVVAGDRIYVAGGWSMGEASAPVWRKTAYAIDLSQDELVWQALPEPPFQRRAHAMAALDGKIYVLGGMEESGKTTTRVDVYDPETQTWSEGASMADTGRLAGFGSAAFALGERLYVTGYDGALQRLREDGSSWERLEGLPRSRFFHRMLPLDEQSMLVVGGANMKSGSYDDLVVVPVNAAALVSEPER